MNEVIALSESDLDILQRLVERSHAYAVEAYPSVPHYLATMHSKVLQINSPLPVCFTGLAGTGKSTLLTALEKALPEPTRLTVGAAIVNRELDILSHARIDVKSSRNFHDFLAPLLSNEFSSKKDGTIDLQGAISDEKKGVGTRVSSGKSAKDAIRHGYKVGLYANLVDEMQFLTQDANASATPTKFLLMMSYINAPLIYAANYSLCNKLLKRNQEDRDRLLGDIIVVRPLELTEQGLGALLKIYDRILGECVDGSLCDFLPEYAAMTLGIKRKIRGLTVAAFEEMRRNNDSKLTKKHLKSAYERRLPLTFRKDIESLHQINSLMNPKGVDRNLWCPFGIEYNRFSLPHNVGDGAAEKKFTEEFLRQSLTGDEKKLVAGFEHHNSVHLPNRVEAEKNKSKPKAPRRRPEFSASELIRTTLAHKNRR